MEKTLSFIRNNNWLAMTIAVVAGVLFVVGGVQAATTISTNIETAGTVTVGEDDTGADVTFYGATSGSYWLWDESADTMIIKAGVASTSAIKVGDEADATTINGLVFGYCTFPTVDITASTTGMVSCAGATGVVSGDRLFVQATSSLPDVFVIQAASSTAADTIQVDIVNLGFTTTEATGINSLNFWAVR